MTAALGGSGPELVVIVITALFGSGAATAIVQWLASRGKTGAEEAEIWTKASTARLKTMHEEMTMLEGRIRSLNEELDQERQARIDRDGQLRHAIHLLTQHGIEWAPPASPW